MLDAGADGKLKSIQKMFNQTWIEITAPFYNTHAAYRASDEKTENFCLLYVCRTLIEKFNGSLGHCC